MATVKLTLSADEKTIRKAKRLARARKTSVSAMFARYIESLSRTRKAGKPDVESLPPITRRALGMVKLPKGKTDRELVEEGLWEKYGLPR